MIQDGLTSYKTVEVIKLFNRCNIELKIEKIIVIYDALKSDKSLFWNILTKMNEDYCIIKKMGAGGVLTLCLNNLRKISQFL